MIEIDNISKALPYQLFEDYYKKAFEVNQRSIEAACISSVSKDNKPHSRFVNLKYVSGFEFIFFSNYESNKALDFKINPFIALNLFWDSINLQIRIEGIIKKTSSKLSDKHYLKRSDQKNALAISSSQSSETSSYDKVRLSYENILNNDNLRIRPAYWGGYSVIPSSFEFWEGHRSRLNKRDLYKISGDAWEHSILQP
tara:strand:+ start:2769 stop:3362 length:594 start_codon:yes stop_codon:yes gene_type:complete